MERAERRILEKNFLHLLQAGRLQAKYDFYRAAFLMVLACKALMDLQCFKWV